MRESYCRSKLFNLFFLAAVMLAIIASGQALALDKATVSR